MTLVLAIAAALAADSAGTSWPIAVEGQPFTTLYAGTAKPYLHPLRTANGKTITRQYPMADVGGESKDHPHHRGLWFSHGDVNGWDFWANEESQKGVGKGKGVIRLREAKVGSGGVVTMSAEWVDGEKNLILNENRTMRFSGTKDTRTIDLDLTLTAAAATTFGDTKEGVFAIRLVDTMIEKNGGKMQAADGSAGEKLVWGHRSPWVDYTGKVDGELAGIAIFDHPSNPRHPTYWHSRAYGLFAANIFGLHDFLDDKTKDGSLALKPGEKLRFRYRVLIHAGSTETAKIADLYKAYTGTH